LLSEVAVAIRPSPGELRLTARRRRVRDAF
jgi:hypothetical protein